MHKNLESYLFQQYPDYFSIKGMECGDGWFHLINTALINISHHIQHLKNQNTHFQKIKDSVLNHQPVDDYWLKKYNNNELTPFTIPAFSIEQVKEKFGTLRIYYTSGDQYIEGVVSSIANLSSTTCEECGNVGKLRNVGWMKTLCDTHFKAKENPKYPVKKIDVGCTIKAIFNSETQHYTIKEMADDYFIGTLYQDSNLKIDNELLYKITEKKHPVFSYYEAEIFNP